MKTTLRLHGSNVYKFLDRVEALNKKLERKNQPKLDWFVSDVIDYEVLEITMTSSMEDVNIKGVDVKFEGVVDLIGQDEDSKVFKLDNKNIYKYLNNCSCDECNKKIGRNKYVVFSKKGKEPEGREDLVVLGTTCAKLYFPFSVESHVGYLGSEIISIFNEFDEFDGSDSYHSHTVGTGELYLAVAEATNNLKFYEKDGGTKTRACNLLFDEKWRPEEPEYDFEKVCEWLKGAYGDVEEAGEFERNVHSILFKGDVIRERVEIRLLGIACYAFVGAKRWYDKEVEKKVAEENRMKENAVVEFFGNVGDKFEKELVFDKTVCYESQFGFGYIHKFHDSENHVFTWFTSKGTYQCWCRTNGHDGYVEYEVGKKYVLKGTVKAHDEYNGCRQTVVTRCKVLKDECELHVFNKKDIA